MKTIDEVYAWMLGKRVIRVDEMTAYSESRFGQDYRYFHKQYVHPFLASGRLLRPRRGLYAAVNVFGGPQPDKYHIASKVRSECYLGYHTALELHGSAQSAFATCFVSVPRAQAFKTFVFQEVEYRPVTVDDMKTEVETIERDGVLVRISTPSRTLVECLRRIDLSGGLEECLKSLEGLRGVSIKSIIAVLSLYDDDFLVRKTGFILERLKKTSPYYGRMDSEKIKVLLGNRAPRYLAEGVPSKLDSSWNLYVPKDMEDIERGV